MSDKLLGDAPAAGPSGSSASTEISTLAGALLEAAIVGERSGDGEGLDLRQTLARS